MEDWEELFEKAEGKVTGKTKRESNDSISALTASKRSKRRAPEQKVVELHPILENRCATEVWNLDESLIFKPSGSIADGICHRWDCQPNNDARETDHVLNPFCTTCNLPLFCHKLDYKNSGLYHSRHLESSASSQIADTLQEIFGAVRNLRCIGKMLALPDEKYKAWLIDWHLLTDETRLIEAKLLMLERHTGNLLQSSDSFALLLEKLQKVILRTNPFTRKPLTMQDWQRPTCFGRAIRLIMACDLAYYQIYYFLLCNGPHSLDRGKVPHPFAYFHSMEGGERDASENVLAAIHKCRKSETVRLFGPTMSWWKNAGTSSKRYQRLWDESLFVLEPPASGDTEATHETPAPQLLSEWRDSSRDFLCHLYAYATLSTSSVKRLVDLLKAHGVQTMADIGAGTAFLDRLLVLEGLPTASFDVSPTEIDSNEYHGRTPPFQPVVQVSPHDPDIIPSASYSQALLLSYPPPKSSMAAQTLRNFLAAKGRIFVHIGEWRGLTGSKDFEDMLVSQMVVLDRIPCLTWGTDVSEVTVWKLRETVGPTSLTTALLLPCCNCKKQESKKRCRLLRCLHYCSQRCCDDHRNVRTQLFREAMVDTRDRRDCYSDEKVFQNL